MSDLDLSKETIDKYYSLIIHDKNYVENISKDLLDIHNSSSSKVCSRCIKIIIYDEDALNPVYKCYSCKLDCCTDHISITNCRCALDICDLCVNYHKYCNYCDLLVCNKCIDKLKYCNICDFYFCSCVNKSCIKKHSNICKKS
jgi:hypothetical protein